MNKFLKSILGKKRRGIHDGYIAASNKNNEDISILENIGISFHGDEKCLKNKNKTLVVLGVARGGTSLISGTLHHLGVFTGEKSNEPVFEDTYLSDVIEKKEKSSAKNIIQKYNESYDIWSYKRPSFINHVEEYDDLFRNPIYLIVFKDIYSIANRNTISMKTDLINGLKNTQIEYEKIINFVSKNDKNYIMFSYEKIMQNKKVFVDSLIELIGENNVTDFQKQNALNFIEPNPKSYLEKSRNNRSQGRVDLITKNTVKGWGKYTIVKEPTIAELFINAEKVDETIANLEHATHSSHGFEFNTSNIAIKDTDKIAVKLSEDFIFLNGSQVENTYDRLNKLDWFNQNQLNNMSEGKYKEADFLRDIATLLLNKEDIENADKIISKALELRPNGPGIIKVKEKVMEFKLELI